MTVLMFSLVWVSIVQIKVQKSPFIILFMAPDIDKPFLNQKIIDLLNMCFCEWEKNIYQIPHLIRSYAVV